MKISTKLLFTVFVLLMACGKASDHSGHDGDAENVDAREPNLALYDQVMEIHDEVMPKMEDIYKIKSQLREKIANSPDMVESKKQEIEAMILQLDAASKAMMGWMHDFDPLPDSVDEEQAREYLEDQMVKIRKVKEEMMTALEEAKKEAEGKE
jgi:hypothetical protein